MYLHNVHLLFFDCLFLEEILGTLHDGDGCYSVADHTLLEVLLCSLVVLWLGEVQRSELFGGLAEGEGGTRGPGNLKVRSMTTAWSGEIRWEEWVLFLQCMSGCLLPLLPRREHGGDLVPAGVFFIGENPWDWKPSALSWGVGTWTPGGISSHWWPEA